MQSRSLRRTLMCLCLTVIFIIAATMTTFAASSFSILETFPKDGAENTTKENMCVKMEVSSPVGAKKYRDVNAEAITIKDSKGNTIPSNVYYTSKKPKEVLVAVDVTKIQASKKLQALIKDDAEYTCTIDKSFTADDGQTLGETKNVKFKTMNQKRNNMIYMVMMFVMMAGMMVFSVFSARKEETEKLREQIEKGDTSFNPYKEAKATGKPVQQVIKEHEAEVAKAEKKRKKDEKEEYEEELREDGIYRVKRPRPAREGGSTYKSGMKAKYEAKVAAEEKAKAERKANNYAKKSEAKKPEQKKKGGKKGGRK
ncbi:MAG: hypothetical protein PUB39_04755 [Eubacteriales bacterium]|nr:hypothetical protein [Eubacteriales bacterium]